MSMLDRTAVLTAAAILVVSPVLLGGHATSSPMPPAAAPPAVEPHAAGGVENGAACQFAIRADNNVGEDVWILFSESYVNNNAGASFIGTDYFEDMSNRRLAPGEKLNARYEVGGRCGAPRQWFMTVRIGARGGERILVLRVTDAPNERLVHLGEAACWASARTWDDPDTDRVVGNDDEAAGCDPSTTRYGLAPVSEERAPVDASDTDDAAGQQGAGVEAPGGSEPARGSVAVSSLQGNWRRLDSSNPRNDGMRAQVQGSRATLTFIPPRGSQRFSEGSLLWRGISGDGSLEVRGSDGRYYPARLSLEGPDRMSIDIDANGPGSDQIWDRSGPAIDGEWVLETSENGENEGMRVVAGGEEATLRYLPAAGSGRYRVGDVLWREIGRQLLEALTPSREYASSGYRLGAGERLRVEVDGVTQLWVRPDAVGTVREGLTGAGGGDDEAADDGQGEAAEPAPGSEGRIVGLRLADDYTVSALSGDTGERSAIVDLRTVPVKALRVQEATDAVNSPCEVAVASEPVGTFSFTPTTESYRRDQFSECPVRTFLTTPVPGANGARIVSDYREGYYLQSLRVCQRRANGRVKGFQTSAVRVAADEATNDVGFRDVDTQEVTLTNCNDWDNPIVRCDEGSVASGVRLRYDVVANGRAEVKGLELICRAVLGVYR